LKQEILNGPVLKRPNWNRRFYLKTDWSKNAMGAVVLQADCTPEAEEAIQRELEGGAWEFDKTLSGLRLCPVAFISRRCKGAEEDYHSFVGEAATGRWAMFKFRRFLWFRQLTWITNCSGLESFFEVDLLPTHHVQRWKMDLLRFDFTICPRPGRMLVECDLLSRYNTWTSEWRKQAEIEANKAKAIEDEQAVKNTNETKQTKLKTKPKAMVAMLTQHIQRMQRPITIPKSNVRPTVGGSGEIERYWRRYATGQEKHGSWTVEQKRQQRQQTKLD
jgi:hypothetical protein